MPRLRLLPLVAFSVGCLLLLKTTALVIDGGYVISGIGAANARNPGAGADAPSEAAPPSEEKRDEEAGPEADASEGAAAQPSLSDAAAASMVPALPASDDPLAQAEGASEKPTGLQRAPGPMLGAPRSEMAVLESLAERRKALEAREREIDLRENLIKAAEKKVEQRIAELKALQSKIDGAVKAEDDARDAELARLVQMYARMKPKEAAPVFNRLDLEVLTKLAKRMKPSEMSAILAQMEPEAAERLTLELARQSAERPRQAAAAELPRVEPMTKQ